MPFKREISTSATDSNLTDSIKRLKITKDGHGMALTVKHPDSTATPLVTVLSNAREDFGAKYEIIREVGKGGFSTVYQCRNRVTGLDYAVKVTSILSRFSVFFCLHLRPSS